MMNLIITVLQILPFALIAICVLLGLRRGTNRSLTRLIIIGVTAVLLFFTAGTFIEMAKQIFNPVDMLGDLDLPADQIEDLAVGLLTPIAFLLLFIIVNFISWIFFAIFVRKIERKGKLGGALIGLVTGVLVSVCFMFPVNGYANFYRDFEDITGAIQVFGDTELPSDLKEIGKYNNSTVVKGYNAICLPLFDKQSRGVSKDIHEISKAVKKAAELNLFDIIENIDFENLDPDNAEALGELLDAFAHSILLKDVAVGKILSMFVGDLNLNEMLGLDQTDQDKINAINEIPLGEFNFKDTLRALAEFQQDPNANPGDQLDAIISTLPKALKDILGY